MKVTFRGEIWYWRGPAPFHFVTVTADEGDLIAEVAPGITYGWGMVPVVVRIGASHTTTSLWPKNGGYIVPLKSSLRKSEGLEVGDEVDVTLLLASPGIVSDV
jgi:hypothetical protein